MLVAAVTRPPSARIDSPCGTPRGSFSQPATIGSPAPRTSFRSVKAAFEAAALREEEALSTAEETPALPVARRLPFAEIQPEAGGPRLTPLKPEATPPSSNPVREKCDPKDTRAISDRLRELKNLPSKYLSIDTSSSSSEEDEQDSNRNSSRSASSASASAYSTASEDLDESVKEYSISYAPPPSPELLTETHDEEDVTKKETKEHLYLHSNSPLHSKEEGLHLQKSDQGIVTVAMSHTGSLDEETFSDANSFDVIEDEIREEGSHDFSSDPIGSIPSRELAFDRRPMSDRRPLSARENIMTDFTGSSANDDSEKGTYHELSTTVKRPSAPAPPRMLGTITSASELTSTDPTSTDRTTTDPSTETAGTSEQISDSAVPDETDVIETTLDTTNRDLSPARPRAINYPSSSGAGSGSSGSGGATDTGISLGTLPFAGLTTPSGRFYSQRMSGSVGDAMTTIWDRFWSEDVRKILRIIRNRFKELLPHIRKFLQHVVAFWGGVTYIRRALSAFVRLLRKDARVRDLLERLGWASSTTLRVFMSLCAMMLQAALQLYFLMRDRVIPQIRRVLPKCYYKVIVQLLRVAAHSPWRIAMGPFSVTAAIDASRVPNPYLLHRKFGVPEEDNTFAFSRASMTYADTETTRDREGYTETDGQQVTVQYPGKENSSAYGYQAYHEDATSVDFKDEF